MGLREIAEADLALILENSNDFGWPVTVTDPSGVVAGLTGYSNDISSVIDPDTGQLVSGRVASIALRISSLALAGLGIPRGIDNDTQKPWVVAFDDINGAAHTFKVQQSNPDRTLGIVTCLLESYKS